jgi:hypothetical protein
MQSNRSESFCTSQKGLGDPFKPSFGLSGVVADLNSRRDTVNARTSPWPSSEIAHPAGSPIEFRQVTLPTQEGAVPVKRRCPRWLSPSKSAPSSSTKLFATAKSLSWLIFGRPGVARARWRRRMSHKWRETLQVKPSCSRSTLSSSRSLPQGTRSKVFQTSPYLRGVACSSSKQAWWTRAQ